MRTERATTSESRSWVFKNAMRNKRLIEAHTCELCPAQATTKHAGRHVCAVDKNYLKNKEVQARRRAVR